VCHNHSAAASFSFSGVAALTTPVNTNHVQASQQYLAAMVNCCDDAIIGLSIDGMILSWNRGAEKLYGIMAEEAKGKEISIIVPADRADEFRGIVEKAKRGETIDHFRTSGLAKDGSLLDVSISTSPIKDESGTIIGFSTIARDITELKKTEEAQSGTSDILQTLGDHSLP